jgi:uncharacterized protein YndB with AHSA1/START domain
MARWFFPAEDWSATVRSDLRVGGKWEVLMRSAAGEPHRQFGEYREISPSSRLVFTWSCPELAVVDSVVTVALIERGAHTELVLTHELPPDPKIRAEHEEGWKGCLQNLERFCTNEEGNGT